MTAANKSRPDGPIGLVVFLWSWRRTILLVTALATVAGVVAAYLITPRYKSEVVLFPAITNSASRALLGHNMSGRDDILALGDEDDAEQLMQMLNSTKVRSRTCDRFDLLSVYGIDPKAAHHQAELAEVFKDNVHFEYTKYGSVRIEVMDTDPQRAADMANFMSQQVDSVWSEMENTRAIEGVRLVENKLHEVEHTVAQLNDSLGRLRSLGVDYTAQSERFSQALGAAIVKGDAQATRTLEERLALLARYGGYSQITEGHLKNELARMGDLQDKWVQARADIDSSLPHTFVVDQAYPADKKSYPIRWLVVAISAVSGFVLAVVLIIVRENIRKIQADHA